MLQENPTVLCTRIVHCLTNDQLLVTGHLLLIN